MQERTIIIIACTDCSLHTNANKKQNRTPLGNQSRVGNYSHLTSFEPENDLHQTKALIWAIINLSHLGPGGPEYNITKIRKPYVYYSRQPGPSIKTTGEVILHPIKDARKGGNCGEKGETILLALGGTGVVIAECSLL